MIDGGEAHLVISGALDLRYADGVAALGSELLHTWEISTLLLDLSAVSTIDDRGVAALTGWADAGRRLSKPIRLCKTSSPVRTALTAVR